MPDALVEVDQVLQEMFPHKFKSGSKCPLKSAKPLTEAEIRAFKLRMGDKVVLIEQKAGEVVFVPPGWVHCVVNMEPCIKAACDLYTVDRFPSYARAAYEVGSAVMHVANAPDYMSWPTTGLSQVALNA